MKSDSYQATRVPYPVCIHGDVTTWQAPESVLELMVERGSLVLDTRLQTIADAWRIYKSPGGEHEGIAPIFRLLDALIRETGHD